MGEDGVLRFTISEAKQEEGIYIPVAAFITAYARKKTITTSQAIKDYSINHYGKDLYYYSLTQIAFIQDYLLKNVKSFVI